MATALIVDDDADVRDILAILLEAGGFEVRSAAGGAEGLDAVSASSPDVVLLDWMMPGVSGLDVCRRLRADPRSALIPVMMLSVCASEREIRLSLGSGVDDYVTKPFSPSDVLVRVERLLGDGTAGPVTSSRRRPGVSASPKHDPAILE
jgi:DNA-binding response OmpR family regulator